MRPAKIICQNWHRIGLTKSGYVDYSVYLWGGVGVEIKWWWLSYADEEKGFLGVVIVAAEEFIHACKVSAAMGLSPGGEVMGHHISWDGECVVTLSNTFRLLPKKEATKLANLMDKKCNSKKAG